ncbi:MAG: hypothetical protein AB7T06_44215 [Kofleriaceae bacterium]
MIDEEIPRSNETVARLTASRTRSTKAKQRRFLAMLLPALVLAGILTLALYYGTHLSTSRVLLLGLGTIFCLAVPAFAARGSVNRELPWITSLVRDAPAFKAVSIDHRRANGNWLIVEWLDAEGGDRGMVEVPYHRRLFSGDVTVLAVPGQPRLAIILDDQEVYVGLRMNDRENEWYPKASAPLANK